MRYIFFFLSLIIFSNVSTVLAADTDYNNGYNNGYNNEYNNEFNNEYNNEYNNEFNNKYNNGYNNNFNIFNVINNGFNNGYKSPENILPDTKADLFIHDGEISVDNCQDTKTEYECLGTYSYFIWNAGPDKAEGVSVVQQLFVNGEKWPSNSTFQVQPYAYTMQPDGGVGAQFGGFYNVNFKKPPIGATITHVLTVNSQNDPNFSNNVFTQIVTIP